MRLNEGLVGKIDPLLEEALMQARGDEELLVIMSLDLKKPLVKEPFHPKEFPSYEDYRRALIEYRKKEYSESLGDTIQALHDLSLKILAGGTTSRVLVVRGSPEQILRALELPGVRSATLDQLIALPGIATDEAIDHIANLYIKTLGGNLERKTKELIYQASEQYIINYHKRHNKLQVLGMQKPVDLDSVYTSVQFLQSSDIQGFESIEALQAVYRQPGKRGFQSQDAKKQDGIVVANQEQYLMVLGAPGAGKTTFLRKIGLEALKGKSGAFQHECIPVFIELKLFTANEINIEQAIAKEFRSCQLPSPEQFTANALQQGKLLILFDGLDEVPTKNMDFTISQYKNFVDQYNKNRFIISCRTAAYRQSFKRFREVEIADFDDTQIKQFIQNWFQSEVDRKAGTAEKCWSLIDKEEAIKELARTPLLLTFLCLVYDESQDLPKNRSRLYSNALDILLRRWAAEKRLPYDQIYSELGMDLEKIMLSEIAYRNFAADKLFFYVQEAVSQIKEFLESNENAPNHLDAEAVLDAIAIQQGILVERVRDVYSFSHLTLQEYLTAQYIDDHRQIEKLVAEHLIDKRWREVFLLVAGLTRGGADELLLLMEKEAQKYINTPKLQDLLRWAEQVTSGSEGDFKPAVKRTFANNIANTIAIAIANDHFKSIVRAIEPAKANANTIIKAIASDRASVSATVIVSAITSTIIRAIVTTNHPKASGKRAKSYAHLLGDAIAYARELEKLKVFKDVNWARLIDSLEVLKVQIPSDDQDDQSHDVRQEFTMSFLQTWCNALHLNPQLVNLSKEERKALENYLNANLLMVQCKQAAVRVSPKTWEAIEERMLLLPGD